MMLGAQPAGIPLPRSSPFSRPFWDGCVEGELRYQYCRHCDRPQFNPAYLCRTCLDPDLEWRASAGRGTIYSWTVAWRSPLPAFRVPYVPVIVDLDEGYQMISNLVDCSVDDVEVGLPVEVAFRHIDGGVVLPYFRPTGLDFHEE